MPKKKKIAIAGGGISGLSLAYKLADDFEVYLFEKDSDFGGLSRSVSQKGYFFDIGPHAFHTNNKDLLDEFKDIIDNEYIVSEKDVLINHEGKYYKYPLKPLNVLLKMNPFVSIWSIINLLYVKTKYKIIKSKDRSADEWLSNRFGRPLYELFFKGYTTKVWGVHPNKLSASFTQHRIPTINFRDMVTRGILNIKKTFDEGHKFAPVVFKMYYPSSKGIGLFTDKIAEKCRKKGVRQYSHAELTRVNIKKGRVSSIEVVHNKRKIKLSPDIFISTMPVDDLTRKINPPIKSSIPLELLEYRALLVVCIIVNKDKVFNPLHFYFRDKFFHRLSELKNFNNGLFPKGKTGLMAEITCDYGDALWKSKDDEILKQTVNDLEKEKFISMNDVEDYFIIKVKNAYPRYGVGFEKALNQIYDRLKRVKNLYSIGRQGLFRYIDMDICMMNSFALASDIKSGKEKKAHDEFDVEDTPYM